MNDSGFDICFFFVLVFCCCYRCFRCLVLLCFALFWCREKRTPSQQSETWEKQQEGLGTFFLSPSKDAAPARLGQRAGQCWGSHTWPRRTCFVKKYVMSSYEAAVWLQLRPFQNDEHRLVQRVVLTQLQQDGVLLCLLGDITSILQKGSYPVSSSGCYNCGL